MKRSWTTYLLIGGLAATLAVLGVFQYRWLSRISASDAEKEKQRVGEQADRFATDFNRELQNAYFNLQIDESSWETLEFDAAKNRHTCRDFNERYEFWKSKTQYPSLIKELYFTKTAWSGYPLKYDPSTGTFATSTPAEFEKVREISAISDKNANVDPQHLALSLPIFPQRRESDGIRIQTPGSELINFTRPAPYGFLTIILDEATIKQQILPDLAAKYFGDGEYRLAVADKEGGEIFQALSGDARDATAGLLDLSPGNFMMFANKDILPRSIEPGKRSIILNSHVASRTITARSESGDPGLVDIQVKHGSDSPARTFIAASKTPGQQQPWTLGVQHVSGSLDAFAAQTLRRNLGIGFGLLFLLAAAIAAIIVSAQRAKMLAQRQVDFVSSVSHEFRTPLAVIYSAGENLADGVTKENAQVSRYGELIKGEGRKLSGMVEQILDFAGADSGRKKYNFRRTDVSEVVRDAITECGPLLGEKDVRLDTDIASTLPEVKADKAALSGAVKNLIANSVKYGDGSKWLRVTAENGGGSVKISVEDRGIGISKGDLKKVFEPFYRSKEVVDAQIHGNGLGLSIVRQVAEAHGGRAYATSEVGKGSKFTIELPQDKEI